MFIKSKMHFYCGLDRACIKCNQCTAAEPTNNSAFHDMTGR